MRIVLVNKIGALDYETLLEREEVQMIEKNQYIMLEPSLQISKSFYKKEIVLCM